MNGFECKYFPKENQKQANTTKHRVITDTVLFLYGVVKRFLAMSKTNTKLRLKAILKWNRETVFIEPILFSWHVGIQYKVLTGNSSGSLFCRKRSDFIFPLQTKIAMLFVKSYYSIYEGGYWQGRRKIKTRIKRYKLRHNKGDLPF